MIQRTQTDSQNWVYTIGIYLINGRFRNHLFHHSETVLSSVDTMFSSILDVAYVQLHVN